MYAHNQNMTIPDHDRVVVIGTLCPKFKKNMLHEEGATYDAEVVITTHKH